MFNILIDLLPCTVQIEGIEYKINSDFRTSLLYSLLMEDNELTEEQKVSQALKLYYPIIPKNEIEAVNKIIWFYSGGKKENTKGKNVKLTNKKLLDYEQDSSYIYSAFMSQYKIDLQDIEYLHWWKFKALLECLTEDNEIVKIIQYRNMDISKIKDKEQKKFYRDMQKKYSLDEKLSLEEQQELEKWNKILG